MKNFTSEEAKERLIRENSNASPDGVWGVPVEQQLAIERTIGWGYLVDVPVEPVVPAINAGELSHLEPTVAETPVTDLPAVTGIEPSPTVQEHQFSIE